MGKNLARQPNSWFIHQFLTEQPSTSGLVPGNLTTQILGWLSLTMVPGVSLFSTPRPSLVSPSLNSGELFR